ncbi:SPOR domain-containing protein [Pseudoalteromonas fenneropenaei]|uniref:SPOR domain-containing protein n=1 Tax=Pseudoalteromonas fenneropenaei TaxID=1737459 RepID=A0ABV7CGW4_9GAMM
MPHNHLNSFVALLLTTLFIGGCNSTTSPQDTPAAYVTLAEFNTLKQQHEQLERRITNLLAVEQELKAVVLALDSQLAASTKPVQTAANEKSNLSTMTPMSTARVNSAPVNSATINSTSSPETKPQSNSVKVAQHGLQLGLYHTEAQALRYLNTVQQQLASLPDTERLSLQTSQNASAGTDYRVVLTGFSDKQSAIQRCEQLTDQRIACFYRYFND